ncbi:hypothetical protein N0V93_010194 [Gnomoniopsis smithogilvyi]|uniref:Uncharacterized protein n=1 Tax=Gnomoniopsis smithogilvyi TaxID=1191159 RepID=A0A9W9CS40_9PEZI|nr:hypothetical protein N0V93_010194 [Gnomoniopsis smithogilvyi]
MGASLPLKVALGLTMVTSAIELSFISVTVGYLANLGKLNISVFLSPSQPIQVAGLPDKLSVNQGHTANGAAGTGLIIIGFAGIIALWLRGRPSYYNSSFTGLFSRTLYRLWLGLNLPALLLTLGALAYVFAVTNMHQGQSIDLSVVQSLRDASLKYPLLEWTPQGWLQALLKLDLVTQSDRDAIEVHYKVSKGWQYNLIPLFLSQLAQTILAMLDARTRRTERGTYVSASEDKETTIFEAK